MEVLEWLSEHGCPLEECDGAAAMAALRGDAMMLKTLARIHGARPASDRLPVTQLLKLSGIQENKALFQAYLDDVEEEQRRQQRQRVQQVH